MSFQFWPSQQDSTIDYGFWIHKIWGWRKGPAVTDTCGSSTGRQFASQSSCWMVHSHFQFHLEEIWCPLLDSTDTCTCTHMCTYIHTHDQLEIQWIFKYIHNILWGFLLIYVVSTFFFYIAFFIAHTIIFTHIMISRLPQVHQSMLWNYISSYTQILYGLLSMYTANKIVFSL